eukprot:5280894-Pyramimonas_sp.AAC.2
MEFHKGSGLSPGEGGQQVALSAIGLWSIWCLGVFWNRSPARCARPLNTTHDSMRVGLCFWFVVRTFMRSSVHRQWHIAKSKEGERKRGNSSMLQRLVTYLLQAENYLEGLQVLPRKLLPHAI